MKELKGDMFKMNAEVLCITTNGFVKQNGDAVMGMGCAKRFKEMYPKAPTLLGKSITLRGNVVSKLGESKKKGTVFCSFPVKRAFVINDGNNVVSHARKKFAVGSLVPGFYAKAELEVILESCRKIVHLADTEGYKNVVIPRMGCGAGELSWKEVKPLVEKILDDRFTVVTFLGDHT